MRLRTQILFAVVGTALASGGVGTWLLGRRTADHGARLLDAELQTGATAVQRQWALRRSERRGAYEAVIRNAYFRAYLLAGDRQQMEYFAAQAQHSGADLAAVLDGDGNALATAGAAATALIQASHRESLSRAGTLVSVEGRVVDAFQLPAGDHPHSGSMLVANYVDARQLREYGEPFGIEPAVRVGGALVSALPPDLGVAVGESLGGVTSATREIGPTSRRYRIHRERFDRGELLVGVSVDRIRALTTDETRLVRALAALIVAAGGIGALFVIARLTNPIARISEAAERLGRGEFAQIAAALAPLSTRRDEIGTLAESFAAAARNVQELLLARRELNQARLKLGAESDARAEADRRAQFFGMLAHELRTPLASLIALNEIALEDFGAALPVEGRKTLELAEQSAHRLLNVVNNMLDLAKLESGRMEPSPVRFDLRELVDECVAVTRVLTRGRPIEVRGGVGDNAAVIESDPGKIRQILINLMGNAAKFVERGAIEVRGVREGGRLRLDVRDDGPGIPESTQQLIFEAFQQGDQSATRSHGGTGLGLTISLRLAEILGGTIRLRSKVGEGSTFTLDIPLAPARDATMVTSDA